MDSDALWRGFAETGEPILYLWYRCVTTPHEP